MDFCTSKLTFLCIKKNAIYFTAVPKQIHWLEGISSYYLQYLRRPSNIIIAIWFVIMALMIWFDIPTFLANRNCEYRQINLMAQLAPKCKTNAQKIMINQTSCILVVVVVSAHTVFLGGAINSASSSPPPEATMKIPFGFC